VTLTSGVTAKQTLSHYFQGAPDERSEPVVQELVGPLDHSYLLHVASPLDALDWSACGIERDLNVSTRIVLQNNAETSAKGSVSVNSSKGTGKLVVRLASRGC
jgi:hypothetical protein